MLAGRAAASSPANPYGAANYGQWMYARKTGALFAAEMARSVREALKNWKGEPIPMANHANEHERVSEPAEGLTKAGERKMTFD